MKQKWVNMDRESERFLKPTELINSDHPVIQAKAIELTTGLKSTEEKARRLFYFIRDEIRYVFRAGQKAEEYPASQVLKRQRGFCTQKAILFCALARSCGIPAGIHFYDIVDYTLPAEFINLLRTNVLYRHGIVALNFNGKWLQYDATLDIALVNRNNLIPVDFSPQRDCLMPAATRTGNKHIEYIRDYGLYSDISYSEIRSWFEQFYPHLMKIGNK